MERGVKLAVVVAAVVCLVAGLAWDRVVRTVVADGADEVAANADTGSGDDLPADPGCRMEFTFVGSMTPPPEPASTTADQPAPANNSSVRPTASGSRSNPDTQLVSGATVTPANGNGSNAASSAPTNAPASREKLYTVRTGDRLGSISKKFFGTEKYWRDIMTYNNIRDPRALRPNQVLKIPPIKTDR